MVGQMTPIWMIVKISKTDRDKKEKTDTFDGNVKGVLRGIGCFE